MVLSLEKTTPKPPSRTLLFVLFLCGVALTVSCAALFTYLMVRAPEPYRRIWGLVPVHFFSGRAGNAGVGLELGFNRWFILFQCCALDFIVMLLAYPAFVIGFTRVSRAPFIGPALVHAHNMALLHRKRIERYGAAGLVLLVAFPLWSTGPLVGVMLGYLLGLRTWLTFSSVVVGNIAATGGWVWFFHTLNTYDEAIARALLIAIMACAALILVRKIVNSLLTRRGVRPAEQASSVE